MAGVNLKTGSSRTLGALVVLPSAALCVAIGAHAVVIGSAAGGWVYPYVSAYGARALGASLLAGGAATLLVAGATHLSRTRPAGAVVLSVIGATAVQVLLWRIYPFTLGAIVRSDSATSFFSAALRHGPAALLRDYGSVARTLPLHAAGNMPGKLLLFRAMHAFTGSPDAMAIAILLLGNLVGVLVFLVALELFADRPTAFAALGLYLFLPSRTVFAPILNGVAPLPVLLALYLWVRFLRGRGPWMAIATGACLFAAILFDPTPLGLGILFVGVALADRHAGRVGTGRLAAGAALAGGALVAAHLAFRAVTGFDAARQLVRVVAEAERFNVWARRPYFTWLVANPVEFLVTLGTPVLVVIAWGLWRRRPLSAPAAWMAIAGAASVLAVDLLGRNRGEVTRLWIFVAVPFVLSAAGFLGAERRSALLVSVAMLAIQGGTMLAVLGFVIP
jgi:hypothetical protein